jgi:hypothetical protein
VLTGCFAEQSERSTARLYAPPLAGPVGDDVVFMDVAVIERPLGDDFLNHELWSDADEQAVRAENDDQAASLERKTALEKNGFRVGQVCGQLPPPKLQDLLLSQHSCTAHRIQLHAGHETTIPLGPLWPHCRCQVSRDAQTLAVDFQKAQCLLEIMPSLAEEGRVRLRFTPHIKHGEVKTAFTALRDAGGLLHWGRQEQQPEEVYPWLSWIVTLTANEYLVIGAKLENSDTLGEQFFLSGEDHPGMQHLLVLRTAHVPTPGSSAEEKQNRSPPLALRANWTAARGRDE